METSTVPCARCGYANRPGKKFCGGCGVALALACAACGTDNPPGARFCDECGAALGAPTPAVPPSSASDATRPAIRDAPAGRSLSPAAPVVHEEERRLVTVLFCDMVGFTPLSASLDPEDVRAVQSAYFGAMSEQVERMGGIVEKYAGDAVLALFGAPIAHEDDAERAVLCALGMQEAIEPVARSAAARWGIEPAIRIGVNTGDVVSGTWNASGRQDVAVTGDAVNTAARIQSAAEPGEVLVGLETMRLTKRRIEYGERRDLVLKGKVGTVPGFPATGVRAQFGERWETSGQASPLVGRDREMLELLDAWIRVQGGDGQMITLVGDAGVGKSRLISEVLDTVGSNTALRVLRGRCLSYGQEISLWLVADLVRTLVGLGEHHAMEEARATLVHEVRDLLGASDLPTQDEAVDVLGEVLGIAPGGSRVSAAGAQVRRQALIRSLRLVVRALSERAATVLVLEDLHWLDEASSEVLANVLSDVPGLRVMVIAAQRPGEKTPWSDWGWTERVTLRPLRDDDAAVLAGAVLGGVPLSSELQRYVSERAGGNPFFVEEMLHALQESGGLEERGGSMHLVPGAAERLPSTLTEVLLARLDRLEAPVRTVAQVASVIGRSFAVRLLAEVVGRAEATLEEPLSALQRAEIAFPRRGSDLEFVFKHVSMREVAYNTLVQKRRQALHLDAARAIAALYPTDEYIEVVAYHYSRTDEHADAAEWLERAGDRAAGVYANETAIGNYSEALKRLDSLDAPAMARAMVLEKLGRVYITAARYDEASEVLERAVAIFREVRDLEAAGRATAELGLAFTRRGTPDAALAQVQPMIDLLSWSGPSQALASLFITMSSTLQTMGRYGEMLAVAERGVDMARTLDLSAVLGRALERRGTAFSFLGKPYDARESLEQAVPLLEDAGDLISLSRALNNIAEASRLQGDLHAARHYNGLNVETCRRTGEVVFVAFGLVNLAEILVPMGEWEEATANIERSADILDSLSTATHIRAYPSLIAGWLAMERGHVDEARSHLQKALAVSVPAQDRQAIDLASVYLAQIQLLDGHPEAARERLETLMAIPDANLSLILPVLSRVALALGEEDSALELSTRAVHEATEHDERLLLVDGLHAHALILAARGNHDEALQTIERGLALVRPMPYPLSEGRLLMIASECHASEGNTELARTCLDDALAIFARLGAEHYRARAVEARDALGAAAH